MELGQWPNECGYCQDVEDNHRADSVRGMANQAYADYTPNDLFLEIRPGNTCNLACQTCWPEASSRVTQFHQRAGLIQSVDSRSITNFDFLLPVANRIRDISLLGGEPFYDVNCRSFISWAAEHTQANLVTFTNGTHVDWNVIDQWPSTMTLVFSLDAVGQPAEYVRYGCEWNNVLNNYQQARWHPKVSARVNVTTSVYNYHLLEDLIDFLLDDWPEVVTFGTPMELYLREGAVPDSHRHGIADSVSRSVEKLQTSAVEINQRHNAVNALQSIVDQLREPGDAVLFKQWQTFAKKMDSVKNIKVQDYCLTLANMLS